MLETVSDQTGAAFGQARLDLAQLRLLWATPPPPTILFPVDGIQQDTATPQIGWTIPDGETQKGFEIRVWQTDTYDENDDRAGNIVYDSCRVNSGSIRSHQITNPLAPGVSYTIGIRLYGEQVNGRTLTSGWSTVTVTAPDSHIINEALIAPQADDLGDGTVNITASLFDDLPVGDWAIIERASVDDIEDAALAARDSERSEVVIDSYGTNAEPWNGLYPAGSPSLFSGDVIQLEAEFYLAARATLSGTNRVSTIMYFGDDVGGAGAIRMQLIERTAADDIMLVRVDGASTFEQALHFGELKYGEWQTVRFRWDRTSGDWQYSSVDDDVETILTTGNTAAPNPVGPNSATDEIVSIGGPALATSAHPTSTSSLGGMIRTVTLSVDDIAILDYDIDRDTVSYTHLTLPTKRIV